MPNTFTALDVPVNDGSGLPFVTRTLGRPKTIVFAGPVLGRYIVEGSNDGGNSWDILVDDSGQQALFTSPKPFSFPPNSQPSRISLFSRQCSI